MGAPEVELFAATTGTDGDWVVKLIDVYPNEVRKSLARLQEGHGRIRTRDRIEIFRGRYLDSFARPRVLRSGEVEEYKFGLPNVDHVFLPGHRLMIQVQSSLFPLYDRNPQTFVPNIFYAKTGDYRAATQGVFYGGNHASAVYLPIVP